MFAPEVLRVEPRFFVDFLHKPIDSAAQINRGVGLVNIVNLILAILLPPVGAFLQVGATKHFVINIVLCFLFWLPAIVHAVWLVATNKKS